MGAKRTIFAEKGTRMSDLVKELMVGDWVMYNHNVFIEDDEPNRKIYPSRIMNGEDIDIATEGCYAPIPLTAEILEKNGFKKFHNKGTGATEETFEYITNGLCIIEFVEDWKDHRFVIRDTQIAFNHVHKLQHALRLLEYNEMADNFKI